MDTALTARWKTPKAYVRGCIFASVVGWAPMLLLPPLMHGGTVRGEVLVFCAVVLGGYGTLEVVRSRKSSWAKILWLIWLMPYAAAVIYGLVEAVTYVPRFFAT